MAMLVDVLATGIRSSDAPVASGLVYTYTTNTSTPATHLYSDNALTVPLANPATLDADGQIEAYCSETAIFRLKVTTAAGVTVEDWDPVTHGSATTTDQLTVDTTNDDAMTAGAGVTLDTWMGAIWTSMNGQSAAATAKDLKYLHTGTGGTGRTVRARFSDVFNVMDFGAAGTGSANDKAAIQAAIDAAATAGGGAVLLPGNIYRCDSSLTITNQDNVAIIGDGPGSILRANFSNAALINITGTSDGIEIASLQLQGGGGSGTTAALGISVASTVGDTAGEVPVNIHDCVFSGASDGAGFNVGVEALGSYGSVTNCHFHRIYGTNSRAVRTNTGAGWVINGCTVIGQDGASTRAEGGFGNTAAGGDDTRVVGCFVSGTSGAGIRFSGSDGVLVNGNRVEACQGAGISFISCTNFSCFGNASHTNGGAGISVTENGAAAPSGFTICGNSCASNTTDGILVSNATDSASYTPRNGVIQGNQCRSNTQCGIRLSGSDKILAQGNLVSENGSNGTYPGIYVTTTSGAATRGGQNNAIVGNAVYDIAGAVHSTPISIADSGGGVTQTSATVVIANNFPPPTGGTVSYSYGAAGHVPTNFIANKQTANQIPTTVVSAGYTLTVAESGSRIVCDTTGQTFTLPALAQNAGYQGLWYEFATASTITMTIAPNGADTMVLSNGSSTGNLVITSERRLVKVSSVWNGASIIWCQYGVDFT